jgi:hypothetical protein
MCGALSSPHRAPSRYQLLAIGAVARCFPSTLISATCRGCFHLVHPGAAHGRCPGVMIAALARRTVGASASVHGDVADCDLLDVCLTVWSETTLMSVWRAGVCTLLEIIPATRRSVGCVIIPRGAALSEIQIFDTASILDVLEQYGMSVQRSLSSSSETRLFRFLLL